MALEEEAAANEKGEEAESQQEQEGIGCGGVRYIYCWMVFQELCLNKGSMEVRTLTASI